MNTKVLSDTVFRSLTPGKVQGTFIVPNFYDDLESFDVLFWQTEQTDCFGQGVLILNGLVWQKIVKEEDISRLSLSRQVRLISRRLDQAALRDGADDWKLTMNECTKERLGSLIVDNNKWQPVLFSDFDDTRICLLSLRTSAALMLAIPCLGDNRFLVWNHSPQDAPLSQEELDMVCRADAVVHYFKSLWPSCEPPAMSDANVEQLHTKLTEWFYPTRITPSDPKLYPSERGMNAVLAMVRQWRANTEAQECSLEELSITPYPHYGRYNELILSGSPVEGLNDYVRCLAELNDSAPDSAFLELVELYAYRRIALNTLHSNKTSEEMRAMAENNTCALDQQILDCLALQRLLSYSIVMPEETLYLLYTTILYWGSLPPHRLFNMAPLDLSPYFRDSLISDEEDRIAAIMNNVQHGIKCGGLDKEPFDSLQQDTAWQKRFHEHLLLRMSIPKYAQPVRLSLAPFASWVAGTWAYHK